MPHAASRRSGPRGRRALLPALLATLALAALVLLGGSLGDHSQEEVLDFLADL